MFRTKTTAKETNRGAPSASEAAERAGSGSQEQTVIAAEVTVKGDISSKGEILIYGTVHGNIVSDNGLIQIMQGGKVQGNMSGQEVVIDGELSGECHAEILDIKENGNINGKMIYQTLSVTKGEHFTGEAMKPVKSSHNEKTDIPVLKPPVPREKLTGPAKTSPEAAKRNNEVIS